jgi:hypothetical protein
MIHPAHIAMYVLLVGIILWQHATIKGLEWRLRFRDKPVESAKKGYWD